MFALPTGVPPKVLGVDPVGFAGGPAAVETLATAAGVAAAGPPAAGSERAAVAALVGPPAPPVWLDDSASEPEDEDADAADATSEGGDAALGETEAEREVRRRQTAESRLAAREAQATAHVLTFRHFVPGRGISGGGAGAAAAVVSFDDDTSPAWSPAVFAPSRGSSAVSVAVPTAARRTVSGTSIGPAFPGDVSPPGGAHAAAARTRNELEAIASGTRRPAPAVATTPIYAVANAAPRGAAASHAHAHSVGAGGGVGGGGWGESVHPSVATALSLHPGLRRVGWQLEMLHSVAGHSLPDKALERLAKAALAAPTLPALLAQLSQQMRARAARAVRLELTPAVRA